MRCQVPFEMVKYFIVKPTFSLRFVFNGVGSDFLSSLLHLKNHHSRNVNLKFLFNSPTVWMHEVILLNIGTAYTLLCKLTVIVTITSHIFIYIFQKDTF